MIFSKKKNLHANLFVFKRMKILKTNDTKFLEVILSSNLSWRCHTDMVLNKISKNIGIISKVRHLISVHLSRSLYLTLVEPYINYCNIIWACSSNSGSLEGILRVQTKILSSYNLLWIHSPFKALIWRTFHFDSLRHLQIYQLNIFMYKLLICVLLEFTNSYLCYTPQFRFLRFALWILSNLVTWVTHYTMTVPEEWIGLLERFSVVCWFERKNSAEWE